MPKPNNLEEEAYEFIRGKIESREWLPNAHLREQVIAERLNMSRSPVRKAFRRLHEEQLVHIEPHKGVRILAKQIKPKDFRDRTEYIELMLNHYIHKLELNEVVLETMKIQEQLQVMKDKVSQPAADFEQEELFFWKLFLMYEENKYIQLLTLEAIGENMPENGKIQKILQQSRQTKLSHLSQLLDYLAEKNYPYARREVRILLNQLNLNVIQGF